jgi:NADH-quinone oxidoreductase subunit L
MMIWILLFAPLLSAVGITTLAQRSKVLSAAVALLAVSASFILSLQMLGTNDINFSFQWLHVGDTVFDFGYSVDHLTQLMLIVVTGVSLAVHLYSLGYMREDPGFARYFAGLSLFTFSMLGVVLANNFVMLFMFWELVGLSSYLLIGFWFHKPAASLAANKAFIVNRVADFGFMLGIVLIGTQLGTVNFVDVQAKLGNLDPIVTTLAVLLIFCGAVGKSAQFPLHVWLPDAMEGPTPVSALIHAATMVAAGVYMLARLSWFLAISPQALQVIMWTGAVTAIFAATVAVLQNDIKRILAYSTLSQLGYMVMAIGLGGPTEAMFHLTTHAFFKALLFLGAGSVIVALHHEQNIWKMGGLRKHLPITFWTFLIGTLALMGVWPFSGFFSKDAILLLAFNKSLPIFVIGVISAVLTAFYMGRLLCVVFFGQPRSKHHGVHESPLVMTLPMLALAVLAIISGWSHAIPHFIDANFQAAHTSWASLLLLAPAAGFGLAALLYARKTASDNALPLGRSISQAMVKKFYIDEVYAAVLGQLEKLFCALANVVEVQLVGRVTASWVIVAQAAASGLRKFQATSVRSYVFMLAAGVALAFYWVLVN